MATIQFKLMTDKADQRGYAPIYMFYQDRGDRFKFATGEKIEPKHWDEKSERARRGYPLSMELNTILGGLKQSLETIKIQSKAQGNHLTARELKAALESLERPDKDDAKATLMIEVIEQFINAHRAHRRPNTLKTYRTLKVHLTAFFAGKRLKASEFTTAKVQDFAAYLAENDINGVTSAKMLQILKRVFSWAEETLGMQVPADFKKINARRPKATLSRIALSEDEIKRIAELPIDNRVGLIHARDVFLFQCYTGLRYSDVERLRPENVQEDQIILVVVKTKERHVVPLIPKAQEILGRYRGMYKSALPVVSNQKFNMHLKELGKMVSLNDPIQQVRFVGNRREDRTVPKWSLLSTHVGRRTFATIFLERGGQPAVLQKLLGHSDIRQTMQYVKLTEKAIKNELLNVWK